MSKTSVRKDIEKSVEEADYRDIFEKALDEKESYERSPLQRKFDEQRMKESQEQLIRTGIGGALGLGAYALGRRLIRKRYPNFDDGIALVPPLGAMVGGQMVAVHHGSYPAKEAEMKRKLKKHKSGLRRKD